MLRRLRAENDIYNATCLVLPEWNDPPSFEGVVVRADLVPDDLSAPSFLATVAEAVLSRTPIDMHVTVRELREQRDLGLEEVDESSDRNA